MRAQKIALTALRVGIGFGLVIYLVLAGTINWRALSGLAARWPISMAALLLLLADVLLLAWRLCFLLRPCGFHLSLGLSFRLTLIGMFFNTCLPGSTGGDVIKIYYAMEGNHGRRAQVATLVLLDRAVGMFALLILPLLIAPLIPRNLISSPALRVLLLGSLLMAVTMLAGVLVCFSERVRQSRRLSWTFEKLPGGRHAQAMFDTIHAYRRNVGTLAASVLLSIVTHLLVVAVTLLAVSAIHPGTVAWVMCVLIPLGHVVNSVPLTPGGLGIGEAGFSALFGMAGLSGGAETLLGWRLLTAVVGVLGFLYYLQGRRRFVHMIELPSTADSATE
jgi:uncharacterized protein (TIRG00374 family)